MALTSLRLNVTGGASTSGEALQVTADLAVTCLLKPGEVKTGGLPNRKGARIEQTSASKLPEWSYQNGTTTLYGFETT